MQHRIEFVTGQIPDAVATLAGDLTVKGSAAFMSALICDPSWRPGMKALVDGTKLDPQDFTCADVEQLAAETVGRPGSWGPGFCAVVVRDPVVYGLTRAWHGHTRSTEWETGVFYAEEDAVAWLRECSHTSDV
jgi:hypothetical protein